MYIPSKFKITEEKEIFSFIKDNAFGQLISLVEGRLFSTHLPFLINDDGSKLICHLAKKNPQWIDIESQEVMVSFSGPHDYISPSWYSSPGVPTWNYQAVHVYGKASKITDTDQLMNIVNSLTEVYESSFEQPWVPDYKASMLKAIVAIEIEVTEIQAKYKLSQNRSKKDQQQVAEALQNRDSCNLSKVMQEVNK